MLHNKNRFPCPARPTAAAAAVSIALVVLAGGAAHGALAAEAGEPLQQVTIVGTAERGYGASSSSTATKTDTLLRDTPQAVTVVTNALIRDQAMQGMADVIQYVPGVVSAQGEGNRDTAVFRGNSTTGDFFVDGVRDDVQYFRDLYNIDSVEALKGPNATIFGRGASGGVINRVSKQPQWSPIREFTVTAGSWGRRRATADVGQGLGESAALRVNAMAEHAGSYRNGVEQDRRGINPTLALRAGANTRVVLGYEHFRDERTADRGVPGFAGRPYPTDPSAFFGDASQSTARVQMDAFTAALEHEFANGVLLRNRTRYAQYDKFYQNVFAGSVVTVKNGVPSFNLGAYNNATARTNLFNQTDLNVNVTAFGLRHTLAAGTELGVQRTDNFRNTGYFGAPNTIPADSPSVSVPVSFRQSATDADNHGVATAAAAYVQDQVAFSPRWLAIAGLRYDRFNVDFRNRRDGSRMDVTDTPLSPRFGLVYKPVEAVSLYASYSRAFAPRAGDQLSSLKPSNASFDPEKFTNVELGAKWDLRPGLSANAAVYRLDRSNVLVTDPQDVTRSLLVDGQRSKGVELGLQGKITGAWSVMGGYAWQQAKLTAAQSASVPAGTSVPQVPEHSLSLWNRFDLTPAFGAAAGVVYRDSMFASTSNAVVLPAFTRVDAALFYRLDKRYQFQLNVENLFDRRYYASANSDSNITPGSPRALKLTVAASF